MNLPGRTLSKSFKAFVQFVWREKESHFIMHFKKSLIKINSKSSDCQREQQEESASATLQSVATASNLPD